jgi:hypothetical protein
MLTLTRVEAENWCREHAVLLDQHRHPAEASDARKFAIPVDAGQRIHLVASDLNPFLGRPESLVWFTEWGIWPSSERPHIFHRFRASYGEIRSLSEVPAHVFGPDESEDMLSFVTLGVLFLWDVHVVIPQVASIFYSHDEWGFLHG